MPFAVEMYMDGESEVKILRIWKSLAEAGIKSAMLEAGYRPHVSLGVCEELDVDDLGKELSSFAKTISPFEMKLSSIGLFHSSENVIFLGVTPTPSLLNINGSFHQFFGKYAKAQRANYHVGSWVPHCTIAFGLSNDIVPKTIENCRRESLPICSRVEEIGIAKVSPISAKVLCAYNLAG